MTLPNHTEQALKLIDGKDGGRRIVDGFRQRLDRDIDDDPECKGRILLDGALGTECDQSPEPTVVDKTGVSVKSEDRLTRCEEVAHARRQFDDCVRLACLRDQSLHIHGQNDRCLALMLNDPVRWRKLLRRSFGEVHVLAQVGVDLFDNGPPVLADAPDDADRTQQPRCVVDQIEKGGDGAKTKDSSNELDAGVSIRLQPGQYSCCKEQSEGEETDSEANGVVAQQGGRDDPRRQLPACDLDSHEKGTEGEDDECQRQRDDRLENAARSRCAPATDEWLPGDPVADRVCHADNPDIEQQGDERYDPQRRSGVAPQRIPLAPRHFRLPLIRRSRLRALWAVLKKTGSPVLAVSPWWLLRSLISQGRCDA